MSNALSELAGSTALVAIVADGISISKFINKDLPTSPDEIIAGILFLAAVNILAMYLGYQEFTKKD